MAPTDNDAVGLTLRELVIEVRNDVREMREDLGTRVTALESDSIKTKAIALNKRESWTKRDKFVLTVVAIIALTVQVYVAASGGLL